MAIDCSRENIYIKTDPKPNSRPRPGSLGHKTSLDGDTSTVLLV